MEARKVIAICASNHGAGKSTLARFIVDQVRHEYNRFCATESFAGVIKDMAYELIGNAAFKKEYKNIPCNQLAGKTPRELFIVLGETLKREFDDKIFVKRVIENINKGIDKVVVIDDLRFPVELEELRNAYGKDLTVVYIKADDADTAEPMENLIKPKDANISITNYKLTDSLGELYDAAVAIVEEVLNNE